MWLRSFGQEGLLRPLSWAEFIYPSCLGSSGDDQRNGCCLQPLVSKGERVEPCTGLGPFPKLPHQGKSPPLLLWIRTEAWSTKKSEDQDCLWFSVHGCVIDSDLLEILGIFCIDLWECEAVVMTVGIESWGWFAWPLFFNLEKEN